MTDPDIKKLAPRHPDDPPALMATGFNDEANEAFYKRMSEKHGGKWVGAWETSQWNPKNRKAT